MDVIDIMEAILRKALFTGMLLAFGYLVDKFMDSFDVKEILKNDPKAIAILYAGLAIAIALS